MTYGTMFHPPSQQECWDPNHTADDQTDAAEELDAKVTACGVEDGAETRSADENGDGTDGREHAESGADVAHVFGDGDDGERREGDEAAGEEAEEDGKCD